MRTPRMLCLASLLAVVLAPAAGLADPLWTFGTYTTELLSPRPLVALQEIVTVGSDLAVTLDWPIAGDPLPPAARLRLSDLEGLVAGTVDFAPLYGPQTIWIPGGALPRSSELSIWPLHRYLELIAAPSREILLESGLDLSQSGPGQPVESTPRRPKPAALHRICSLDVTHIRMSDSEDYNGDDPTLLITDAAPIYWQEDIRAVSDLNVNDSFLLCNTCSGIDKTLRMELWDRDDPGIPVFDPHDHLGTVVVSGCGSTPWTTTKISGENHTYEFVWRVSCAETDCS